jgi:hypothetical protein
MQSLPNRFPSCRKYDACGRSAMLHRPRDREIGGLGGQLEQREGDQDAGRSRGGPCAHPRADGRKSPEGDELALLLMTDVPRGEGMPAQSALPGQQARAIRKGNPSCFLDHVVRSNFAWPARPGGAKLAPLAAKPRPVPEAVGMGFLEQEFPAECVPLVRGKVVQPMNAYVAVS